MGQPPSLPPSSLSTSSCTRWMPRARRFSPRRVHSRRNPAIIPSQPFSQFLLLFNYPFKAYNFLAGSAIRARCCCSPNSRPTPISSPSLRFVFIFLFRPLAPPPTRPLATSSSSLFHSLTRSLSLSLPLSFAQRNRSDESALGARSKTCDGKRGSQLPNITGRIAVSDGRGFVVQQENFCLCFRSHEDNVLPTS
jgi:hypothetical protein